MTVNVNDIQREMNPDMHKEIIKNIVEYDLFEVLSDETYGNCTMNIFNDRDVITIQIMDLCGDAIHKMDKADFVKMNKDEMEKLFATVLYYNYQMKQK